MAFIGGGFAGLVTGARLKEVGVERVRDPELKPRLELQEESAVTRLELEPLVAMPDPDRWRVRNGVGLGLLAGSLACKREASDCEACASQKGDGGVGPRIHSSGGVGHDAFRG